MQFSRVAKTFHNFDLSKFFKICVRHKCDEIDLKKVLKEVIPKERERIRKIKLDYGDVKVGDITVKSIYNGMRGLLVLVNETSQLDNEFGIRFRGFTIPELIECLPKAELSEQPLPEGVFWLMCTGEIPTAEQCTFLSKEWACRSTLPSYITKMIDNFPKTMHTMAQLTAATTALNMDSHFVVAIDQNVKSIDYWESTYEDAMNLIAKVNTIAARIYVNVWKNGEHGEIDIEADWTLNFMKLIGFDDKHDFVELMRLYLMVHSDHSSGNVSAHTVHLVASALSDPYLAYAAGMNGLAGPLHGLANQMVLHFKKEIVSKLGPTPSDDQLKEFIKAFLKAGHRVPGFGHATLRIVDPRYKVLVEFAQKYMPDDELVKLTHQMFRIVPPILKATGKVSNPWPNVDAGSGVLLYKYGMTQDTFYTVLFAVSRALGVMAQVIWDRALLLPIERPKSITSDGMEALAKSIKCKEEKHVKVEKYF